MPPGTEAVAVWVVDDVPAPAMIEPLIVKVTAPPTGISTDSLIAPAPLAAQVAPPEATQVQETPVNSAGGV